MEASTTIVNVITPGQWCAVHDQKAENLLWILTARSKRCNSIDLFN